MGRIKTQFNYRPGENLIKTKNFFPRAGEKPKSYHEKVLYDKGRAYRQNPRRHNYYHKQNNTYRTDAKA